LVPIGFYRDTPLRRGPLSHLRSLRPLRSLRLKKSVAICLPGFALRRGGRVGLWLIASCSLLAYVGRRLKNDKDMLLADDLTTNDK